MHRWIAALILIAGLPACQSMPWKKEKTPPVELLPETEAELGKTAPPPAREGLSISPKQRFRDIPLPAGVTEDLDRSYVYESPGLQIGRMVYTSRAPVNELAQFYIREMPAGGWTLESVLQANGAQLLFRKPGRRLEVLVKKQGAARSNLLVLNLTPETAPQ